MTERPAVFVLGDAVQQWAVRWRTDGPADAAAAVTEGIDLCDAVIARATPLLADAAVRPPSPQHLQLLRAILGTWKTGAWRLRKRLPAGQEPPALAAAVDRAWATIHALSEAEAGRTSQDRVA